MLHNLEAEIARKKLTKQQVADRIGIGTRALYDKINGRTKFTTEEAFKLQKAFFPDQSLGYLFEQSDSE